MEVMAVMRLWGMGQLGDMKCFRCVTHTAEVVLNVILSLQWRGRVQHTVKRGN